MELGFSSLYAASSIIFPPIAIVLRVSYFRYSIGLPFAFRGLLSFHEDVILYDLRRSAPSSDKSSIREESLSCLNTMMTWRK